MRGQSCSFSYNGIQKDGTPFILAPSIDELNTAVENRRDYTVLAFTIKTTTLGDVVLEKYFDLEAPPMYDGKTDYTPRGYHKFTNTTIEPYIASKALEEAQAGIFKVYNDNGTYVHIATDINGDFYVSRYGFKLTVPIEHSDTAELKSKEYVYDLILYYGKLTEEEIKSTDESPNFNFPLDKVELKNTLISPHKFILEDSNNV